MCALSRLRVVPVCQCTDRLILYSTLSFIACIPRQVKDTSLSHILRSEKVQKTEDGVRNISRHNNISHN